MKTKQEILDVYFYTTAAYTVTRIQYDGKTYLSVPVTMMVEGVHHGSHGPVLHLASELGKIPDVWNGVPITIGHPQINGNYVSANSPEILANWSTGIVFNARMDGDALKADAWIDETRLIALSPELLQKITNGEIIEVSVGVFCDEEETEGVYNEEHYIAVARNHRPNHLALLPDEVGACSIVDGCGIRVNKKGGKKVELLINESNERQVLKELATKGFSVNETGHMELSNKAQNMLNAKDGNGFSYYLEELFDSEIVYQVCHYDQNGNGRTVKFYKQSFQENAAREVELLGEAVQVKRVVEYPNVQVNKDGEIIINLKKEEITMSDKKCTPCVKATVDGLITNKATSYAEADRDWLEALTETQLEKMTPVQVTPTKVEVTKEQALSVLSLLTKEEYMMIMPAEIREQVQTGLRINAERKATIVFAVLANTKEAWTKEELEAFDMPMLEKVYKSISIPTRNEQPTFAAFGSGIHLQSTNSKAPLLLPDGVGVVEKTN